MGRSPRIGSLTWTSSWPVAVQDGDGADARAGPAARPGRRPAPRGGPRPAARRGRSRGAMCWPWRSAVRSRFAVVGLGDRQRLVERALHLRLEPALDRLVDEVGGDEEDQRGRRHRQQRNASTSLARKRAPITLCRRSSHSFTRLRKSSTSSSRKHDQVQVEQREDDDVRGDRQLGREDRPDRTTVAPPISTRKAAMMTRLRLRRFCSSVFPSCRVRGIYWLRLTVKRLDCIHGVSSASPVKRVIQELTPPCDTSERTRT